MGLAMCRFVVTLFPTCGSLGKKPKFRLCVSSLYDTLRKTQHIWRSPSKKKWSVMPACVDFKHRARGAVLAPIKHRYRLTRHIPMNLSIS